MRNKIEDGEAVSGNEPMSFERPSGPSSDTNESIESHSSGTLTPDITAYDNEAGLLYDADELDEKGTEKFKTDAFASSRHYRDNSAPRDEKSCLLLPRRSAVWSTKGSGIKLSALAAAVLINENRLKIEDLEVISADDEYQGPSDPISGIVAAAHSTMGGVVMGIVDYPLEITKMMKSDREVAKNLASDFALDSGKGISRIIGTGLRAPMDFTMNISRGFGNVPRLYGDDTVRRNEKITGIDSGIGAGVKGLGLGLYDGITGLVTQPVKGAQQNGVGGFFKGLGKGIGGVICKPAAGAVGLPALAFKGLYEEIQSKRGLSTEDCIRKELIRAGQEEWQICTVGERAEVLGRWYDD